MTTTRAELAELQAAVTTAAAENKTAIADRSSAATAWNASSAGRLAATTLRAQSAAVVSGRRGAPAVRAAAQAVYDAAHDAALQDVRMREDAARHAADEATAGLQRGIATCNPMRLHHLISRHLRSGSIVIAWGLPLAQVTATKS